MFRIVILLKKLLKAVADPALNPNDVNTAWVQNVWSCQDNEWVRKYCLGGQEARIRAIAQATLVARQALYDEFCIQNKVGALLDAGGNFRKLEELPDFDAPLAGMVTNFFKHCYKMLSHNVGRHWDGYEFHDGNLSNRKYKDDFCCNLPTKVVCPYCDGEIGSPDLDHYLFKDGFPLLVCSPWNLIPVCKSCNDVITAKGNRPAITFGPPHSTDDWLHPFFRPASTQVHIKLSGDPQNSIPQLHSPDPAELIRVNNHTDLIRSLGKRWTAVAAVHFDVLVRQVKGEVDKTATPLDTIIRRRLDDFLDSRGQDPSSMVKAAVCQAVLDLRSEYVEEFTNPNSPGLD